MDGMSISTSLAFSFVGWCINQLRSCPRSRAPKIWLALPWLANCKPSCNAADTLSDVCPLLPVIFSIYPRKVVGFSPSNQVIGFQAVLVLLRL